MGSQSAGFWDPAAPSKKTAFDTDLLVSPAPRNSDREP